jgi:hypothetical protein
VDLLVILGGKPGTSATALNWVKTALSNSFPYTTVAISRPTVKVLFNNGLETWEIIPGFRKNAGESAVYDIPGVGNSNWLESAPIEHIKYVNEVNSIGGIVGGAKKLARLAKAWKYYNNVPMSSFYLEMRAAEYMSTQSSFIALHDVCYFLEHLDRIKLASMNDPKGLTSPFYACSSDATGTESLSRVNTAATRAYKALNAYDSKNDADAFYYLDLLFGGTFPARY